MIGDSQAPGPLLPPEGAQEPPAEAAGVRAPTVSTSRRHGKGDRDGGRGECGERAGAVHFGVGRRCVV